MKIKDNHVRTDKTEIEYVTISRNHSYKYSKYDDGWYSIKTSMGTFHWPYNSSEKLTNRLLKQFHGKKCTLNCKVLEDKLRDYPDRLVFKQILKGISEGFTIGYTGPCRTLKCASRKRRR